MKRILDTCSRRHGFDGWVVVVKPIGIKGAKWHALRWTFSTIRSETRELLHAMPRRLDERYKVTKANLTVEAIGL